MKMAFYGGAQIILSVMLENISPGHQPTKADYELLPGLQEELNNFAEEMRKVAETKFGRA